MKSISRIYRYFFQQASASGILLMMSAFVALLISNSPLQPYYDKFLNVSCGINFHHWTLEKPLLLWINEGLMTLFFLLVSLEIKRSLLVGELKSKKNRSLPLIAALGGMIAPALIYVIITHSSTAPGALHGWAIPTATDIAFSLTVLSFFGNRIPNTLKIFLTALAILDDLGAILIIAIFYTIDINFTALTCAALLIAVLFGFNYMGIKKLSPYCLLSLVIWVFVLKSGIHATLVGVILAFALPMDTKNNQHCASIRLEHKLHSWVSFLILPLFALSNSGVPINYHQLTSTFSNAIPLAIILGLVIGKPLGIVGSCFIGSKLKLAKLPQSITWTTLLGLGCLCGIGFTMSLFIGTLAFEIQPGQLSPHLMLYQNWLRMGVLIGSICSGLFGYFIIKQITKRTVKSH